MTEPYGPNLATASLYEGDVLSRLVDIPDNSVDLVISSPPYNIGKPYERDDKMSLEEYAVWQTKVVNAVCEKVKESGSVCWQVGSYVHDREIYPLDILFYDLFKNNGLILRNRIIWRFNFGHNSDSRFSGRYETVLWFTKSGKYKFNLDSVRVPQLYPGKRHAKGRGLKAGQPSGNPKGKNPSDYWEFSAEADFLKNPVWDIPNVKANHPEKTSHPCQFPIELAERCVLAMTDNEDVVLDPFVGTGSAILAALKHNRNGIGIDRNQEFLAIAKERVDQLRAGVLPLRNIGTPVRRPVPGEKVSSVPKEWLKVD